MDDMTSTIPTPALSRPSKRRRTPAMRISMCSVPARNIAYGSDIRYKPPYEPVERYLELARRLGFVRYVFVQPSAYGFDNSCMLDAMRQLDPAVRRGIIDLDENNTSDKELADLNAARRARHPRQHLADPQTGGRPRGLDAAADRSADQNLRRTRLASRLPDAGLAGQRVDADVARTAGRIFGRAYGAVSRPRTGRSKPAFRSSSIWSATVRNALLGQAHRASIAFRPRRILPT